MTWFDIALFGILEIPIIIGFYVSTRNPFNKGEIK